MVSSTRSLACIVAFILFVAVCPAVANDTPEDPGAGPVIAYLNECLAAHLQQKDTCPEPQIAPDNSSSAQRVASRLARASYYVKIQELEKATTEVDAAIAVDANSAQAHHLAARISMVLGDSDRTQREAITAHKLAPNDPAIHMTYALMLQGRQANTESIREMEAVIAAHPDYLFAHEQRGLQLMRLGDLIRFGPPAYAAALVDFNYLVEHAAKPNANLLANRARAFLALGRSQSAVADLSAAIELEPHSVELLARRASAYSAADLDELAVKDLNTLLATNDGNPQYILSDNDRAKVLTQRALVFVHLRRFDDAAGDVVAALGNGGARSVLRAQVFLRQNGFPDVAIDGKDSPGLRQAVSACFGLNACFQGIMKSI